MLLIRLLLVIDIAVAAVFVYFFFVGLADGSVSSFNIGLWLAILAALAAILGGGWTLHNKGQRAAAIAVLAVAAIPGLLFGLFVLSLVVTQPHWN